MAPEGITTGARNDDGRKRSDVRIVEVEARSLDDVIVPTLMRGDRVLSRLTEGHESKPWRVDSARQRLFWRDRLSSATRRYPTALHLTTFLEAYDFALFDIPPLEDARATRARQCDLLL